MYSAVSAPIANVIDADSLQPCGRKLLYLITFSFQIGYLTLKEKKNRISFTH